MSAAALIHAEIASGSEKNGYDLRKKFAPAIYEIALEAIQEESEDS
jgi:hypothetical protein